MPSGAAIFPLLIYAFIFIIGLLNIICPKIMWRIFQSWKASKEPSKTFFLLNRIGGIIAVAVVIALVLFPYLMSN
jgi:hypothetical protein